MAAADALLLYLQTWIDPETGVANQFLDSLKSISSNTEVVMLLILGVFAAAHSGLAYLRPYGELQQPWVLHVGHSQQLQLVLLQLFLPAECSYS